MTKNMLNRAEALKNMYNVVVKCLKVTQSHFIMILKIYIRIL